VGIIFGPEAHPLLGVREELKGGAMFLFESERRRGEARKAKTASPACRKNPSGFLPEGKNSLG